MGRQSLNVGSLDHVKRERFSGLSVNSMTFFLNRLFPKTGNFPYCASNCKPPFAKGGWDCGHVESIVIDNTGKMSTVNIAAGGFVGGRGPVDFVA